MMGGSGWPRPGVRATGIRSVTRIRGPPPGAAPGHWPRRRAACGLGSLAAAGHWSAPSQALSRALADTQPGPSRRPAAQPDLSAGPGHCQPEWTLRSDSTSGFTETRGTVGARAPGSESDLLSAAATVTQHWLKRCIIQVGIGHGHIHHHMKRFDHCLWLCRMALTTGIFPGWTGYFPRKKSGEFEGKIRLAHGRPRPAGRPAIVTCSRSAWTTGAVERLSLSFPALRDAKERLAAVRRRAGQPRQLKQTSHAVLDTLSVLVPRVRGPEAPPPPASLVAILMAGHAVTGPTTGYVGQVRPGHPESAAICHSRPSRPNSSTPWRRRRRRTPAAHRRRCVSAALTRQAN